jgi:ABC-type transport system involved in cytochrome c biogenesis permease subunit
MSTTELGRFESRTIPRPAAPAASGLFDAVRLVLSPLASLRLTVVLLGLSIILVLAGTLAQVDRDLLFVLQKYFRAWIAWFELRIFFPRSWGIPPEIVFPFPGGKLLGLALALNLVAAHMLRFHVAARGLRLWLGWATIAAGAALTYVVIVSGSNKSFESELSPLFANGLWHAMRALLGGTALTLVYILALTRATARQSAAWWLWMFGAVAAALLAGLAVYLFFNPAMRLDASGLRILWQLAKASAASLVLGAGCWAVFSKRAGIVLIHGGIGLMMFAELYTMQNVVEARMTIHEGQTAYWADDIRAVELTFTATDDPQTDRVVAIPGSLLAAARQNGNVITHEKLPFDVRVKDYFPNAALRRAQPGETSVATAGLGQLWIADQRAETTGVETEQVVDLPAAVVELLEKSGGKTRGVYLLSTQLAFQGRSEVVPAPGEGGKAVEAALRFKRIPKPYEVTLLDFKFQPYVGSTTAKNFQADVQFRVPAEQVDRRVSIWMNNPLRYGGDTLYQASWDEENESYTVLQVMTNAGWMVPYVACMIVAAGMLVHFSQAVIRFVFRREAEARLAEAGIAGAATARVDNTPWSQRWSRPEYWVPALVVLVAVATTFRYAAPPKTAPLEMKLHDFGRLPIVAGGRTQPMDSLAQNTLRVVSGKATYVDPRYEDKQPAIRWFLEVASRSPDHRKLPVVRIENLDVLASLGLPQRPGDWRYSLEEIFSDKKEDFQGEFAKQVQLAKAVPKEQRNLPQLKVVEADEKVTRILMLQSAFDELNVEGIDEAAFTTRQAEIRAELAKATAGMARPVPPTDPSGPWLTVYEATYEMYADAYAAGKKPGDDAGVFQLLELLNAYAAEEPVKFNSKLVDYTRLVDQAAANERAHEARLALAGEPSLRKPAEALALDRIAFESFFNHFDPFIVCLVFYIAAFLLAAGSWLFWPQGLNRTANWLLWFTFALHTFGLICRIYISGRPPVTNLYSSAVFIGWAGVLFALLFEVIYKVGIGNLLAALLGVPTMIIAYQLTFDATISGDTFGVMQAVLDTNFWLGTHVVCIALGYATTLVAGALGIITLLVGVLANKLDADLRRQVTRMTYGTLCFAIFFSFVGTVLGGLWADDSWGRFWGWDPKENGALMIVLWNAIVLHARWGKMIGERGLAALVVLGNIVVAWSWWGVNQLGVGLHAYGEISGITFWLVVFATSQIMLVAAAYLTPLWQNATPTNRKMASGH